MFLKHIPASYPKIFSLIKTIYNLSTKNVYEELKETIVFKFKIEDVFASIVRMEECREKILNYLADPNNINEKLLLSKFYNHSKKAYVFGIHNF